MYRGEMSSEDLRIRRSFFSSFRLIASLLKMTLRGLKTDFNNSRLRRKCMDFLAVFKRSFLTASVSWLALFMETSEKSHFSINMEWRTKAGIFNSSLSRRVPFRPFSKTSTGTSLHDSEYPQSRLYMIHQGDKREG